MSQRDIKFRVWYEDCKSFGSFDLFKNDRWFELTNWTIQRHEDGSRTFYMPRHNINYDDFSPVREIKYPNPAQSVLEQFTGLIDKSGREIYEGDILHIVDPSIDSEGWSRGVVEWFPEHARFGLTLYSVWTGRGTRDTITLSYRIESGCPVMGNIHDNRELLCEPS